MGTLTESLKGCCVREEPYKILVDPISDSPEENDGVSNNQTHEIDEKKPQDISMHGVTVSEKGWCFSYDLCPLYAFFYLFPDIFSLKVS